MEEYNAIINSINEEINISYILESSPLSKIYIGYLNNKKSIIKIYSQDLSQIKIDRKNEIKILNEIRHLDLSPKILFHDVQKRIIIYEYIDGDELILTNKNNERVLSILGKVLKKIHKIKTINIEDNLFRNSIYAYKEILKDEDSEVIRKGFDLYEELSADNTKIVFSHNDLNKSNLLINNNIIFLDWEYASFNHPYFDIATIVSSLELNEDEINILWGSYSNNKYSLNKLKLEKWIKFKHHLDYYWSKSIARIYNIEENSI